MPENHQNVMKVVFPYHINDNEIVMNVILALLLNLYIY